MRAAAKGGADDDRPPCRRRSRGAGDGKLLSRVMDNLMNNIGKYAMPGTRVYAAAAAVKRSRPSASKMFPAMN